MTREGLGRRGTRRDPVWANRRRLLRGRERLSFPAFAAMWNDCINHEPTEHLLAAWIAKEGTARPDVAHRLPASYSWCADADIPELVTLTETVQAWWPQILAFLQLRVTNERASHCTFNRGCGAGRLVGLAVA